MKAARGSWDEKAFMEHGSHQAGQLVCPGGTLDMISEKSKPARGRWGLVQGCWKK